MRRIAAALLCLCSLEGAAWGQERRVYVEGGATVSGRSSDPQCTAGSGCPVPAESGAAWGISSGIGVFVTRTISVGVDVNAGLPIETVQETAIPAERSDKQHSDLTITAAMTIHSAPARTGRLGVTFGGGLLREAISQRSADKPFNAVTFPDYGPTIDSSIWLMQFGAGVEWEMPVTDRVAVVPAFRLHALSQDSTLGLARVLGLGSIVWRGGVTVRAAF